MSLVSPPPELEYPSHERAFAWPLSPQKSPISARVRSPSRAQSYPFPLLISPQPSPNPSQPSLPLGLCSGRINRPLPFHLCGPSLIITALSSYTGPNSGYAYIPTPLLPTCIDTTFYPVYLHPLIMDRFLAPQSPEAQAHHHLTYVYPLTMCFLVHSLSA